MLKRDYHTVNTAKAKMIYCGLCGSNARNMLNGLPLCYNHLRSTVNGQNCAICLENLGTGGIYQMTCCGQVMHKRCLGSCRNASCPLCR